MTTPHMLAFITLLLDALVNTLTDYLFDFYSLLVFFCMSCCTNVHVDYFYIVVITRISFLAVYDNCFKIELFWS